ncbi:MAG: NAD-dependent epimerase/dehydratase family protein [Planctomycetota bacterium]
MVGSNERSRREVLKAAGGLAAVSALPMSALGGWLVEDVVPKRILFLGGTGFLGPHMVRRALERGHDVTLFNRGRSNPHLFPEVTKLVGDRYTDLTALEKGEWDVVIDTFTYLPTTVRATVDLLRDRIDRYVVVSTISVYGNRNDIDMDEAAPLAEVDPAVADAMTSHREVGMHYGAMKALCERAAEEGMPGRVWNNRPGLIVGPGDVTNRFTYWPWRVRRGGEVLAPGEPGHYTQFIDVRDLANFIILGSERGLTGACNAVSPARHFTMGGVLDDCKEASGSDATFTWTDAAFLQSQGVMPWQHMTCWVPPSAPGYEGFGQISAARAVASGMQIRPVIETARDTLAWVDKQDEAFRERLDAGLVPGRGGAGLSSEREAEVLSAWRDRVDEG